VKRLLLPATLVLVAVLGGLVVRHLTRTVNYTPANRPHDTAIRYIVIHNTEETLERSLEVLEDGGDVSAHYLVDTDGRVVSLVPEQHIAWHCGNRELNAQSIGIEVVGYASQTNPAGEPAPFTDAQYRATARLVREISARYDITPTHNETRRARLTISGDAGAVFGHDQVPSPDDPTLGGGRSRHGDPGPAWDWTRFMQLVAEP
jgi:N-acetyl-anhydromuramyl-L-alanine amidase AmpD